MNQDIREDLRQMSRLISEMVELVYQGFMENDTHYLTSALNKERIIDDLEKEVIKKVVEISRSAQPKEQKGLITLGQVAQNIERMGDELRSLMERMEIKIEEKLFFSELDLKQYQEVFDRMRNSVDWTRDFFEAKNINIKILDKVLKNGLEMKKLVEQYRRDYMGRVAKGSCPPRAVNMYFDMLDFTGNIARHCTNIARGYKEK
jgi:Na+/phosphate symporter